MKCDEVLPLIDPLLDNELPTQPTALIMEHIRNCPNCQDAWDGRLALRERFQRFTANVAVPDKALDRLDQGLQKLVRRQHHLTLVKKLATWSAAAALVLVPLTVFVLRKFDSHAPVTAEEIVRTFRQDVRSNTNWQRQPDLSHLSQQAGFSVADLKLPDWNLASADMLKLPHHSQCIVKLVYVRNVAGKTEHITCYQACQGRMKVAGLNEQNIQGRYICCGKIHNLSVVYWPREGRD
ncbi:MAG: zf-HC2 domain-containing protein, partial [Candidatus Melainabacteria bacterium]|nr:zf-HC2 domain-containing protein [Candidatus Melainabacteria bacterium]